jgi:hypothetical protein
MAYKNVNLNPAGRRTEDCAVRALAAAMSKPWKEIYTDLCVQGSLLCDMPCANRVWKTYLIGNGWGRHRISRVSEMQCTVKGFADSNQSGTFLLEMPTHVVCVQNGDWIDTWDCGNEVPKAYWEENNEHAVL